MSKLRWLSLLSVVALAVGLTPSWAAADDTHVTTSPAVYQLPDNHATSAPIQLAGWRGGYRGGWGGGYYGGGYYYGYRPRYYGGYYGGWYRPRYYYPRYNYPRYYGYYYY